MMMTYRNHRELPVHIFFIYIYIYYPTIEKFIFKYSKNVMGGVEGRILS